MPTDLSALYPEFTNLIIQTYFFWMYDIWTQPDWAKVTQIVPSTKDAEFYPTLTQVPTMQAWEGRRRFERAGAKQSYMVMNAMYDAGISFPRNVFADDQYGILQKKISDLAMEGKRKPMALAYDIINNGAASSGDTYAVGIDGLPLFSASHPGKVDVTATDTQSNTNGAGTSTSLTVDNLNTAVTAMKNFYDNQGRPLWIIPDTLIVPPALGMVARQILHSTFLMSVGTAATSSAVSVNNLPTFNVFNVDANEGGIKTIIETPYITSATAWYVACTSRVAKPVLLQERMPPELTIKMDPNTSDLVFQTNDIYCSILARWGAAPGDWHTIFKGNS